MTASVIVDGDHGSLARFYDWCGDGQRTPEKYPYAFSTHFLWRDGEKGAFGVAGSEAVYTDRMAGWDRQKAREALKDFDFFGTVPPHPQRTACQRAVDHFFGPGKYTCVGYGLSCNQSNGYPIGVFFLRNGTSG